MSPQPKSISGPKGLLRIYMLHRLSKSPMSGYDLISDLDATTGGSWHPGSGSIYPILEELSRQKLIEVVSKGHRAKQVYSLTRKGREELVVERKIINQFARKWNKLRLTFLDLMNADNLTALVLETTRLNRTAWESALESKELQKSEISLRLKEYKLLLEDELRWINVHLKTHA